MTKFITRIVITALSLALCLSVVPTPALGAPASMYPFVLQEHILRFYFDPALVPDIGFAKTALLKYVADLNTILAKNTSRRLLFDPETSIILSSSKPQSDSAQLPLPTEGFEIWAYALHTDRTVSYGGYAGMDRSGAGVLAGLNWTRIYDPDNLTSTELVDYSLQINNMLHELAHVLGAGIGEYYRLASITDTTSVEPLLNIKLSDPNDAYWSDKPDFMPDPLLRFTRAATRSEYLAEVQYSNLTAAVMSGAYRNGIPSFDQYTVQVLDESGSPFPGANVRVWNVRGISPYSNELLFDGSTDENGQVILPWGGWLPAHNAYNFLRLIKVFNNGVPIAQPRYVSIFDIDAALLVSRSNAFVATMTPTASELGPGNPTPVVKTLISTGKNDGWVLESASGSRKGGGVNATSGLFYLGDDAANRQYRSILSFNTGSLPNNAVITKATLRIMKQGLTGMDPFLSHGDLKVSIHRGHFSTKAQLQLNDFQAAASQAGIGKFSNTLVEGWYSLDLDSQAYPYINVAGSSQFRLQFTLPTDEDGRADYLKIYSGNAGDPLKRPELIVEYYLP